MKAKVLVAVLLAVLASTVVAGCGKDAPKQPATPLPSYLALYPAGQPVAVYFLQWEQAGEVDGTLTVAYPDTSGEVSTKTEPVTGTIHDGEFALEVGDPAQRWKGTRSGRTITFTADLGDGSTETLTFVPAKLAAYKRAVEKLR
jgi:hypothetical protein